MDTRTRMNLSSVEFDRFNIHTFKNTLFLQAVEDKVFEIRQAEKAEYPDSYEALEEAEKEVINDPKDENAKEKLRQAQELVNLIYLEKLTADYKKLAIVYAFLTRQTVPARIYAEKYRLCIANNNVEDIEYAEALSLVANSFVMHPDYKSNDDCKIAIEVFKNILAKETDEAKKDNLNMQIAFMDRYLGLMARRQQNAALAQEIFACVLEAQKKLLSTMPQIKIDLGETYHLIGATKVFEGKNEEGKQAYLEAIKYEDEFVAESGAPHFLQGITGQSLGLLYGKLRDFKNAFELLEATLKKQIKFYGVTSHADIAKTLQFIGETYEKVNDLDTAINYYSQALEMKQEFYAEDDPVLIFTKKSLDNAISEKSKSIRAEAEVDSILVDVGLFGTRGRPVTPTNVTSAPGVDEKAFHVSPRQSG
jgi:tetratricopeptide (TPR) repeat protein